jgi:hypothetical protein
VLLSAVVIDASSAMRRTPAAAPSVSRPAPWAESIAAVDNALAQRNISRALKAWHPAYAAALHDGRWDGLIDVGEARLRIERVSGFEKRGQEQARVLYLMALSRARQQRSAEGVLRAAAALHALGDREVAAEAIRMAATLEEPRQVADISASPEL